MNPIEILYSAKFELSNLLVNQGKRMVTGLNSGNGIPKTILDSGNKICEKYKLYVMTKI